MPNNIFNGLLRNKAPFFLSNPLSLRFFYAKESTHKNSVPGFTVAFLPSPVGYTNRVRQYHTTGWRAQGFDTSCID
jgi:hypothetical protein